MKYLMNKHNVKPFLFLALMTVAISMACMTAQNLVFGTPTPVATASAAPVPLTATVTTIPTVSWTPVACQDETCLNSCLDRINQALATNPLKPVEGNYAGANANFNLVIYKIKDGKIIEPNVVWVPSEYKVYQQDTAAQQRVWDYYTALFPSSQIKWLSEYVVYTDGPGDILAWVDRTYDDSTKWRLGVDILDSADPVYLTETLVHETGHLITLNPDQIPMDQNFIYTPYQDSVICKQFMTSEGCSKADSYINLFYQKFWKAIYNDWLRTVYKSDAQTDEEIQQVVYQFYAHHPGEFVSEYAATNIKEDLAETFTNFVLHPKPTHNYIADRKVNFFYGFSDMVALRQQVIQAMCSYAH